MSCRIFVVGLEIMFSIFELRDIKILLRCPGEPKAIEVIKTLKALNMYHLLNAAFFICVDYLNI